MSLKNNLIAVLIITRELILEISSVFTLVNDNAIVIILPHLDRQL